MKKIDYLIITHTATGEGKAITKADIIVAHTTAKEKGGKGWNRPAIDYLIAEDGSLEVVLDENNVSEVDLWGISQGTNGLHGVAKYIAYVGGKTLKETKDKDTRTPEQMETLENIVRFYIKRFPKIQVLGFNEVPALEGEIAPHFQVGKWLEEIDIPREHIFNPSEEETTD